MNAFEELTQLFEKFPGIGKRQARRFSYFIARQPESFISSLVSQLQHVHSHMKICQDSGALFLTSHPDETRSTLARDPNRDDTTLLIVASDADLETIEKSGQYHGRYFVLGGTLPLLAKHPERYIRAQHLQSIISEKAPQLQEVILGLPVTPQGEHTESYITEHIAPLKQKHRFHITHFGRGVSTGSEIEYSDPETIKNALQRRAEREG